MKNFKSIFEQKKIYTRAEMIKWCNKNIKDFDIPSNIKDQNKYLNEDGESRKGFAISEDEQTVHRVVPNETRIITDDTFLPFKFDILEGITLKAPNLKEFSFKNTLVCNYDGDGDSVTFEECNSLDFSNLDYLDDMVICFYRIDNLLPQYLCKNRFVDIQFRACKNKQIYDFGNYDNMHVENLEIWGLTEDIARITNISNLIEKQNILILVIRIFHNALYQEKLCDILDKYIRLDNKRDHIMDFTVEMIDAGFEDML